MKNLLLMFLFFTGNLLVFSQSCSVNAGGNTTICGTSYTLQGTTTGTTAGTPTWTIVSKPSGATDPVFSNPNILTPVVTGMNTPGNYVFQVTQNCSVSGPVTSQVTILAPGANTGYSAGPDITGISAITGVATLNATIPAGYTPSWTFYNIYNFETNSTIAQTNATMSGTTTATPTLTLTNKANHTIDPAYRVILRITSVNNPSCWYEDDAIVRFTPNPNMLWNPLSTTCVAPPGGSGSFYYDPTGASPRLATTTANSSGNPAFGTTVSMAVVSQPPGGNIQYSRMENGRLHFSGITATGDYVFDLTISNTLGTYTNRLTYRFNGFQPSALTFLDPAHPAQTELYSAGNSGGAVYCNMVGSTAPITFYYKTNAADPPTILDVISIGTQIPAGGAPTFVQSGAGTANRSVTLTPPSGGWRAGTYKIAVTLNNGCTRQHVFYAHISDNARPAVNVDNITVCYPGSGVVTATVPLPASYIAPASNPTYFQEYGGRYDFTLLASPAGSATPTYEGQGNRSLTSASTVISNLNTPGEYRFRIRAVGNGSGKMLTDEFACSGASMEDTFSIFVTAQVGANAGSDQNIVTASTTTATLNGNNAGTSTGTWSLVSKPAGAPDPVIVSPSVANTTVTGLNTVGAYTFRWTIATGTCTSFDETIVNVNAASPGGVTTGLSYWYRADMNAANTGVGTDVTGWTDVWNGTTVAQWGTNAFPKYAQGAANYFNFNSGINFTAITQSLANNVVQSVTNTSNDIFTVTKEGMTAPGSFVPHFFSITENNAVTGASAYDYVGMNPINGQIERRVVSGGTQFPNAGVTYSTTVPSIMYNTFTNTTLARALNGAANSTPATSYSAVGLALGGHVFGNTRTATNGVDNLGGLVGDIGETIIYGAGNITAVDRRKVDSYLAIKYGITLARVNTDHYLGADAGMVWNGAANTAYNNNIFGVAREDIGVFHQKVSKSVNAGTILTVATIDDFVNPNLAPARTGLANDKTYFLLGDNNVTSNSLTSLNVNGTTMQRIQRTWLSQRTNTAGALYFEADLSTYGNAFESGNGVEMIIADDAAFTTNAVRVTGTYTSGKWVFSNNFNPDNTQRYITFARTLSNNCVSGCNPNTFVNSVDPNTIEYDNMVSTFHSTIIKENDGTFKAWGQKIAFNGTSNLLVPTAITAANSYNYTGTPLRATGGSDGTATSAPAQFALLTTDGLYVWGTTNTLISSNIKNTTDFDRITVNGKTDGLPPGVTPSNVKMMFGSYGTLAITTCNGEAWVLSFNGSKNGDGTTQNTANNIIWHRVKTDAPNNPELNNVVAIRGTKSALLALTSTGELYTWGTNTYINSGAAASRTYATQVTVPSGVTPKMIGMTSQASLHSYYLLATDGKLYTMGDNSRRQLGDGSTLTKTTWVQPQKPASQGQGTGALENIAWISPNEHDSSPTGEGANINVLTNNNKQWTWGLNSAYMIGGVTTNTSYEPIYMPGGLNVADEIIAVETGGHTSMNIKKGVNRFGYVGHRVDGSMGNGNSASANEPTYTYNTADVAVCGAVMSPAVQNLTICNGTTANLNDANLTTPPSDVEWHATNSASSPVIADVTAVSVGTYYAFYTVASGKPRTVSSAATVTGVVCCTTGDCNPNTYVNSVDPNTIEYDNIVSSFHATVEKGTDGTFKTWGEATMPNGTGSFLSPTAITPANGFAYTGTPLKVTSATFYYANPSSTQYLNHQHALLTTDGLYVWGNGGSTAGQPTLVSKSLTTSAAFQKITVNGKADGLPAGVMPQQVKMMFGSGGTLAITTCSGEAWVLSMYGDKNGDGTLQDATNNVIWHRVKTSATTDLTGVVAMRGTSNALFALTSDGKLYTWGTGTYINNGSAATNRTYATEVTVPTGVTPKMIGMTSRTLSITNTTSSYFLLATNGKLYAMGDNASRQLGDGTTTIRTNWIQPQKVTNQSGQGIGNLEGIVWISPNEHSYFNTQNTSDISTGAINVLTNDYKQWAWGSNNGRMIGGATTNIYYDPMYMPGTSAAVNGLKITDELIAVETGGHTSMNIKKGENKFGYVGHYINGSMGNGTVADSYVPTYSYDTAIVTVCGAETSGACYKPGVTGPAASILDTKVGITALGRAGAADTNNWPMIRKGGWLALEAKTKGFVPNRVAFDASGNPVGIAAANFVEGMMVFDTVNKCMKMYTSTDGGATFAWYCISTQTCTDISVGGTSKH